MAKIKMKTNKSAAKRFKKTASGKIKRYHASKNHILTKKDILYYSELNKYIELVLYLYYNVILPEDMYKSWLKELVGL